MAAAGDGVDELTAGLSGLTLQDANVAAKAPKPRPPAFLSLIPLKKGRGAEMKPAVRPAVGSTNGRQDKAASELDVLTTGLASLSLGVKSPLPAQAASEAAAPPTESPEPDEPAPLRDYQRWLVSNSWTLVSRQQKATARADAAPSVLVYLPTGGGKTRVASELVKRVVERLGHRALFVVNRTRLVCQTAAALERCGLSDGSIGFIKAGKADGSAALAVVASMQTLAARHDLGRVAGSDGVAAAAASGAGEARPPLPRAALVVIDEAHCAAAPTYAALIRSYRQAGAVVVGLSATPTRLRAGESLGVAFDRVLEGPGVAQLVRDGVLVPPITLACGQGIVDRALARVPSGRASRGGARDYDAAELCRAMEQEAVVAAAAASWVKHGRGRRTAAFCVSVAQAAALAAHLRRLGVASRHIEASTPEAEREETLSALREGSVRVVASVGVLSEGFDEPRVGCVLLLRPTLSKVRRAAGHRGWAAAGSAAERGPPRVRRRVRHRCRGTPGASLGRGSPACHRLPQRRSSVCARMQGRADEPCHNDRSLPAAFSPRVARSRSSCSRSAAASAPVRACLMRRRRGHRPPPRLTASSSTWPATRCGTAASSAPPGSASRSPGGRPAGPAPRPRRPHRRSAGSPRRWFARAPLAAASFTPTRRCALLAAPTFSASSCSVLGEAPQSWHRVRAQ